MMCFKYLRNFFLRTFDENVEKSQTLLSTTKNFKNKYSRIVAIESNCNCVQAFGG